jgi:hypothetical protein
MKVNSFTPAAARQTPMGGYKQVQCFGAMYMHCACLKSV